MTKDDLRKYIPIRREIEQLDRERAYWYSKAGRCTSAPSRAPTFGGEHDGLPFIIDKIDAIREVSEKKLVELYDLRRRIEAAVDRLDGIERTLIRARYIEGKRWEEIAVGLNYSWKQIHRIHGHALEKLKEDTQ